MKQIQKQINCSPARQVLDTYLRMYKHNSSIELNDDLILLITINLVFTKLEIIFSDYMIDLLSIKIHLQQITMINISVKSKNNQINGMNLNCDKYINIIRQCKSTPIYTDQISGGVLFFLYNLLLTMEPDLLLSRYNIHKQAWLDILTNSTHMIIETHQHVANTLSIQDLDYIHIQLESLNVISRLFAIFSLIEMPEYAENIKKSIKMIIDDEISEDVLDW